MQHRNAAKSILVRITLATLLIVGLIAGMAFAPFASAQAPPPSTVTLMVKLAASMSAADRQALMDRYGATVKSDINKLGIEVVEIPADNAAAVEQNLRQEPGVLRVEESKTRKVQALPNDAQVGSQWALPQIAWDQVYGSVNPQYLTKVAILDTGVDGTHTDLMGSLAAGTSIIDGSNGLTDLNGHGTWLAGIVAARTNNIDGIAGVGYSNVQVMPVKVADANGDAQDDDVVAGVMYAADNGASVILMAFSNTGFSDSLQDAIDYAWSKNVVLVAAAGNDGSASPTFPAGDRGVMGVSATDQSDNLAAGSNYGQSIFIAAPGVSILGTGLNNSYVAFSGTSASAAIVAGAATLMRAVDPTLTNGVVVSRLARNADPAGTQAQTGNGRLQIARAIADTDTTSIQPAGAAPVGGGGPFVGPYHIAAKNLQVTITGTGTGVVTVHTTDSSTISVPPACTGAGATGNNTSTVTLIASCGLNMDDNSAVGTISAAGNGGATVAFSGQSAGVTGCGATSCNVSMGNNAQLLTVTFNVHVDPPTISKAFTASTIALNGTTTLTFTLTNPNAAADLTGVAFSDTLTGGLQVNSTPGVSNTCGGGTVTAAANSTSISLSNGTITHAANCTISVTVKGTIAGTVNNTTGAVSSTNGGTGTTSNTASLIVDGAAPVITVSFTAPNGSNGWNKTAPVTGTASATDSANVTAISCSDTLGGLTQGGLTGGGTTTASRTLSVTGEGTHNISCTATDGVGNNGAGAGSTNMPVVVKIDTVAPAVTATADRVADHNGWYNHSLTVTFTATDATSDAVTCDSPVTYTGPDSATASVTGHCTDSAGNQGTGTLNFKYDGTAPTAALSVTAGTAGTNGWYTSDVTVHTAGTETISTPISCTADQFQTTETPGTPFNGSCTNDAGLTGNATALNVKLDKTAPTATLAVTAGTAGTNGWYTSDVTIGTSGTDSISSPVVCTADQHQTTETTGAVFNGSCTNNAGLTTNATALNVKLDKTAPVVNLSVTAGTAGTNGWYTTDVTVHTAGTESISFPVTCSADQFQTTETSGTPFNGSCSNDAGLTGNATALNIKLDKTPPSATLAVSAGTPGTNGWYTSDVTVHATGTDSISSPVTCSADQFQTTETTGGTFNATCTNNAGLHTDAAPLNVKLDKTAPTAVALAVTAGTLGANGWYTSDVTIHTSGTENISTPIICTTDQIQSTETTGTLINGSCTNDAGLTGNATALNIKLDKTPPTATLAVSAGTPGTNGWYTSNVTVHATGTDTISSPVTCTADQFQTTETTGTAFNATCTNNAGLHTDATALNVKLDKTPPTAVALAVTAGTLGANGWYTSDVTVHATGTDTISTPVVCTADQHQTAETTGATFNGLCTNDAGLHTDAAPLNIKLDKTPPTATLAVTAGTLGSNGWYISDVTIHASGTDTISSPVNCAPLDQFQTTETTGATFNATCTNDAGLHTDAAPLNIKLDKTPPTATLAVTAGTLGSNGWYTSDVTISTSGTETISTPITCTADQHQTTDTTGTAFNGSCTNAAGLSANATAINIKRDATAPTVTATPDRPPDHNGWYNHALSITFTGADSTSGVFTCDPVAPYSGPDSTTSSVSGHCTDNAGNVGTGTFNFKFDSTPPTAALAVTAGTLGSNNWYTSDVTIGTSGADSVSSPVTCTADQHQTTETTGTAFNGSCTNDAGLTTNAAPLNVKLDKTGPTAVALAVTAGTLGANNWYTSDVTIHTSGTENISNPITCTADQTQSTETTGTLINGSCTNDAGLTTPATALNIKLDKTAPVVSLAVTAGTPGTNGWYTSNVTVHTSGSESISSPINCTVDQFQNTETAGTLFNGSCTNDAGLIGNATALNVKLDKTGPTATLAAAGTLGNNGWYVSDVTISTSGMDSISSSVTCSADQHQTSDTASATFNGSCTNDAGLHTDAAPLTIKRDATAPTVSATPDRPADHNGWYNHTVTTHFAGADSTSGVASCDADAPYSGPDSATASVSGHCVDNAGNQGTGMFNFKFDSTGPTATLAVSAGTLGANGWYTSDITVHASGADAVSSPVTCSADQFQTTETVGTAFNGSCTNDAGLTTNAAPLNVKLDKTGPTSVALSVTAGTLGTNYWYISNVTVHTAGTDSISGPVTCTADQNQTTDTTGTNFNGSCTNNAGLSTNAAALNIKLDKTLPVAAIVTMPSNPTNSTSAMFTFTATDATSGVGTVTCQLDLGMPTPCAGTQSYSSLAQGSHTFTVRVTDNASNLSSASYMWVVDTTPPVVSNVTLSSYAVPMGSSTSVTLTGNVSDVTTGNSNIIAAKYSVNGLAGPWIAMTITPSSPASPTVTATANLTGLFATTNVLNICVTGTDAGGNTSVPTAAQCAILAVYDPSGGFVTGGGWIISPVKAGYPYMTVSGKANFGFVSQYKKGQTVPTGNTQFQFQEGNLDFESSAYQWLVVSGSKAQFQGTGTINGTGNYGFQVFAYDGSVKGSGTDMDGFRIQIGTLLPDGSLTNIVYDNMFTGTSSPGSGTEPLDKLNGNGSVQIH